MRVSNALLPVRFVRRARNQFADSADRLQWTMRDSIAAHPRFNKTSGRF
jgi:hypothetical protein